MFETTRLNRKKTLLQNTTSTVHVSTLLTLHRVQNKISQDFALGTYMSIRMFEQIYFSSKLKCFIHFL